MSEKDFFFGVLLLWLLFCSEGFFQPENSKQQSSIKKTDAKKKLFQTFTNQE